MSSFAAMLYVAPAGPSVPQSARGKKGDVEEKGVRNRFSFARSAQLRLPFGHLFFADTTGRRLSLERREITGDSREDLLKKVIEELIKGPVDEDRIRTFPEVTLVRAVYAREQTVWVDLGGAVQDEHPGGAWTEVLAVYSIVNTLTENFTDVSRVQILINGRESETFAGHVDISKPLTSRIQLLAGDWE